jgi:hypothetical protein
MRYFVAGCSEVPAGSETQTAPVAIANVATSHCRLVAREQPLVRKSLQCRGKASENAAVQAARRNVSEQSNRPASVVQQTAGPCKQG